MNSLNFGSIQTVRFTKPSPMANLCVASDLVKTAKNPDEVRDNLEQLINGRLQTLTFDVENEDKFNSILAKAQDVGVCLDEQA